MKNSTPSSKRLTGVLLLLLGSLVLICRLFCGVNANAVKSSTERAKKSTIIVNWNRGIYLVEVEVNGRISDAQEAIWERTGVPIGNQQLYTAEGTKMFEGDTFESYGCGPESCNVQLKMKHPPSPPNISAVPAGKMAVDPVGA